MNNEKPLYSSSSFVVSWAKILERMTLLLMPIVAAMLLLQFSSLSTTAREDGTVVHPVYKRQTYHYPEALKEYAQNYHSGTRVIHGTLGRFAPQDWPAWYTRTMMKWNGESRMSPYSPNDVQYRSWRMNRILSEQP